MCGDLSWQHRKHTMDPAEHLNIPPPAHPFSLHEKWFFGGTVSFACEITPLAFSHHPQPPAQGGPTHNEQGLPPSSTPSQLPWEASLKVHCDSTWERTALSLLQDTLPLHI